MKRANLVLLAVMALAPAALAAPPAYKLVDQIPGPDGGWDYVRVDPVHERVLVTRGSSVMSVDLATGKVTAGIAPGARLHDALPVNGGAEILVTNGGANTAVFVDAKSGAVVATVPTGAGADAAAFDPATGLVLVMDHAGGDVVLIDPKTHAAAGKIEVGGELEAAAVDGAGKAYVNVEDKSEIAVIDLKARKVLARYPLAGCEGPTGMAYDAADKLLITACDGATDIVQAADGKVLQTLNTGRGADGVAWDAGRHLAFVPAGRDGTLAVISLAGGKASIVQTVKTRISARTLAEDPRTGRVYLPSAEYGPPPAAGGRPSMVPGSFRLLVVGPG
jgi:hypothetical protein